VSPIPITVGTRPFAIAITPDGKTAYVANFGPIVGPGNVSVINTADNKVSPIPIAVGSHPSDIAITPEGKTAYVANFGSSNVSAIDTADNSVDPTPIPVGTQPEHIAITPDGKTAYVANIGSENVSVIDTGEKTVSSNPITVGIHPADIAIASDGKAAYVANFGSDADLDSQNVSVIDTATNKVSATRIKVGTKPFAIAIGPDQPPRAAFTAPGGRPEVPLTFDASASKDPDSQIRSFGDGQSQTFSSPTATHVFANPGTYSVSLKETDAEGCSTLRELVFTGQMAMGCTGNAGAEVSKQVTVAYPGVSVKCPKSAKPKGCAFKLQAIAAKPKARPGAEGRERHCQGQSKARALGDRLPSS
jgi:YVTN family beta-propeller protein